MSTTFFAGAALFILGASLVMGVTFAEGDWRKLDQLKGLGALFSGRQHGAQRIVLFTGVLVAAAGVLLIFAEITSGDLARTRHCGEYCRSIAFEKGVIGPSDDPARRGLACTCTSRDGRRRQVSPDVVVRRR